MDNLTEYLNVRIEPDTKRCLESHAQRRNFKLAQLVRIILGEWLNEQQRIRMGLYTTERDDDD